MIVSLIQRRFAHDARGQLTSFELYADGKELIINDGTTAATKQRRKAMLLHLAGPDVQEIFTTLTETGDATNYASVVEALSAYFGHR